MTKSPSPFISVSFLISLEITFKHYKMVTSFTPNYSYANDNSDAHECLQNA